MSSEQQRLPRLRDDFYRGSVAAHWTFGLENRATGWLNAAFHGRFREVLTHACARYGCACPVYCLMPDHMHLLLMGTHDESDVRLATIFLRKHLAPSLVPACFQKQAYDHVLREEERHREAFTRSCHYILENPVRTGLCATVAEYRFSGALVVGYPDLRVHEKDYWELFWRVIDRIRNAP